ncbi:MAG: ECF transporter S component [Syntrophomonadaceae bacterium]|nr:ECF transporter S component [Syntrophomonadaceae bacterium]
MNKFSVLTIMVTVFVLGISIVSDNTLFEENWILLSTIIMVIALLGFFGQLERSQFSAREITLIATMAGLAAVARMPFAYLMSIQPTFFIAMITGYVFGSQAGFTVGAVAIFVSNFYAGQGAWTPWQMVAMGIAGASAALLARSQKQFSSKILAIFCGFWGYLYGWIMNFWNWTAFVYPLNLNTFLATYIAGFAFDSFRAIGNIVFTLLFAKSFYQILLRFRKKSCIQKIDLQDFS